MQSFPFHILLAAARLSHSAEQELPGGAGTSGMLALGLGAREVAQPGAVIAGAQGCHGLRPLLSPAGRGSLLPTSSSSFKCF